MSPKGVLFIMEKFKIHPITLDELNKCSSFWDDTSPDSKLARLIQTGERQAFVYCQDGEYVGGFTISIREGENGRHGHFSYFSVRSDLRNNGIGKRMLEYAYNFLNGKDIHTITLNVHNNNPSAKRLYERQGFVYVCDLTDDKFRMKKEI
jgi:ribosomal protein S18 acetylase RimI-like enzyme